MNQENQLRKLLSRWRLKYVLTAIAIILISSVIGVSIKERIDILSLQSLIVIGFGLPALASLFYIFLPKLPQIIALLNRQLKDVEYSAHLLDIPDKNLLTLQQIQKNKVTDVINMNQIKLPINTKPIIYGSILAAVCLIILGFSYRLDNNGHAENLFAPPQNTIHQINTSELDDTLILNNVSVHIAPPAYTNLKSYRTKKLNLNIPEKSSVTWYFDVAGNPDKKELIFEEKRIEKLNQSNKYSAVFPTSSFYNYRFAKEQQEIVSDYYPIKIIEDQIPKVSISGVKEHQRLEYKNNYDINFKITSTDDYGLSDMFLLATLAKGSGESVKFREKKIVLKDFEVSSTKYDGNYSFSTNELGMEPGDELYFYAAAKDNCPFEMHWSKSTTHFVIFEDTSKVTLVDAGGMQLDMMPDFFRSQRQIIIDTEQLIAEQDSLSEDEFKQRSNELGYDQKLLRLKYGQFLGEEAESGLDFDSDVDIDMGDEEHDPNHDHSTHQGGNAALNEARSLIEQFMHDHDHEEEENQILESKGTEKIEEAKNPQWVKDMSHNHDNRDEATFFEMSIKNKLRAALSEMWDSELHLRLIDPEKSLPYQFKCLDYLEDIKTHARAYVQRIGFEPPIIKEQEKRLSGNLKEIYSTRDILKVDIKDDLNNIMDALPIIMEVQQQSNKKLSDRELNILQKAGNELSKIAIIKPVYLPVLSSLRELISNQASISDSSLMTVIKAFQDIIPGDKKEATASNYFRHPINVKAINEFEKSL